MLILGPSRRWMPESSLGFMLDVLRETCGARESLHAWGPKGPDYESANRWMDGHSARGPVLIFGTALALYRWMERVRRVRGRGWVLPPGSRVVETGGFKGRRIILSKREFYEQLGETLGLEEAWILAEYGMTELGSQLYDNTVAGMIRGGVPARRLVPPPWLRVSIWDLVHWRPLQGGQASGPIAFQDPVNLDSLPFIVTEDLGRMDPRGLTLEGRMPGAEPRGCSLLAGQ